ncbi:hypothetical protein [Streptomyces rapamycinicus]|uniref:DNA primase/polymerase bifunctional N-terminal domain-containing protein n=2 Tax=Streptomyces rapamycinicus TaxID=1226757 RepID=A0A0A0NP91_STRRN|nr:hypothetical protein [Streptomyces rapamycinicus]AGP56200.1 hypothetical protein M271_23450 [Streptomyces rapamycinicus NRRL 5491]MBB4783809.1 hypothetical protein [Streptomyces rapamycinicus]RLV80719.1 hypothetical protein D3C57_120080 [Streptomyces rapamycinicus NRRL 5491]UTO64166.1 hypothetical protein LJB45_18740 [Streptomyces rapamycinicus]UTP32121.1 hypothetical protein LIV37_23860 [Streptomyces rapamycinicus NRRL 5491]
MPTDALPWTPPANCSVQMLPAGRWWDAVQAPRALGEHALRLLGDATGAVIDDPRGKRLAWLIAPGASDPWDMTWLPGIELRGQATYVHVPAVEQTEGPGVHWRVPLAPGRYLTEPAYLLTVLQMATKAVQ